MEDKSDPIKYLESRMMSYIEALEELSTSAGPNDAVKANVLKALLNKGIPDKQKMDVTFDKSPYELIEEAVKRNSS